MTRTTLIAALGFVFCASLISFAADEENPYKNAKVGDWAEYKSTTEGAALPQKMESTMKQSVTAKTDKEVTIKNEMNMAGGVKNESETKIDLTTKYDPAANAGVPGAKVEKGKEGDEDVTVGGKTYKTHWSESKITMNMAGTKFETETKSWVSKDVPLGGLIKSEMKQSIGMKITTELIGSGTGK